MPRFMLFIYPLISEEYAEGPSVEAVEAMTRYNEELTKAGALLALDGLHREAHARSADGVTDGPFSEAKELVGGYWIIQAKDREEALEWAKRVPLDGESFVEVRQIYEMIGLLRGSPGGGEALAGAAGADERVTSCGDAARDRGGLADRVRPADRRARADGARRQPRRGPRAGRARRRAGEVAAVGRPGQPGRLADGHRQAPRDRPDAPQPALGDQAAGDRVGARRADGDAARRAPGEEIGDDVLALMFTAAIRRCPRRRGSR